MSAFFMIAKKSPRVGKPDNILPRNSKASAMAAVKYASWDMGIRNLALCIVEVDGGGAPPKIFHWEMCNILEEERRSGSRALTNAKSIRIESAVEALVEALQSRRALWEGVSEVVIEQQPVGRLPVSNTVMKVLSHVMQGWFYQHGAKVRFCSPKRKLGVAGVDDAAAPKSEKAKERYARHKRAAIEETRRRLALAEDHRHREWFESLRKQDDAADAFLQALVAIEDDKQRRAKAQAKAEREAAARAKAEAKAQAKAAREAAARAKAQAKAQAKAEREAEKARKAEAKAEREAEKEARKRLREEAGAASAPKRQRGDDDDDNRM